MAFLTAYLSWALAALRRAVGTARLSDAHVGLTDAAAPRSPATNSAAVGAASLAARVAAACCGCASTVSAPTEHTAAPPDDYSDLPGMLTHPDLGGVILGWIADDTGTATALRGVSRGCRDGVAAHAWADEDARIGSPARWRAAFPAARVVNVSRNKRLCDADFVHFRGIHTLIMWSCKQPAITDAAFGHLVGIHSLYMGGCSQSTITDAAFSHLAGIHTLDMNNCSQRTITDAAFGYLSGIHTLCMSYCNQSTITDAALSHLAGIHSLYMSYCNQTTITDAAFSHLAGIHSLYMIGCSQRTITAATRARLALAGIPNLVTKLTD